MQATLARLVVLIVGILGLGAGLLFTTVHPFSYTSSASVQEPAQLALKHTEQHGNVEIRPVTKQVIVLTATAPTAHGAEVAARQAANAYLVHQAAGLHGSTRYRQRMQNASFMLDPASAGQPQRALLPGAAAGLLAGLLLGFLAITIIGHVSGRRVKPATA